MPDPRQHWMDLAYARYTNFIYKGVERFLPERRNSQVFLQRHVHPLPNRLELARLITPCFAGSVQNPALPGNLTFPGPT